MTATVGRPMQAPTAAGPEGGAQVADVFVVFGITGDLAKVMTFHSLYRLEKRASAQLPDRRSGGERLVR